MKILFPKPPDISHLRIFGCLRCAHARTYDKFHSRSRRCVSLGYPSGKNGWHLYNLDMHQFFVSRDVHLFKNQFPFSSSPSDHFFPPGNTHPPPFDIHSRPTHYFFDDFLDPPSTTLTSGPSTHTPIPSPSRPLLSLGLSHDLLNALPPSWTPSYVGRASHFPNCPFQSTSSFFWAIPSSRFYHCACFLILQF